ncbi:MAG: hypothetical protein JXO22_07270 [Phycisphaerae bacterium]|nr:hypothetical protein [Phycisphaerae bacterium]
MRKFKVMPAAMLALLLGFPMAEEAKAQGVGTIINGGIALTFGILDLVGDS